jgi:DUF4097 and DUF4098 domain-containing protein YvlB
VAGRITPEQTTKGNTVMTHRIARLPFATLALALALASGTAAAQQSIDKVLGSITAQAGQAYGDLETVNGSISIETGATTKDAGTVNGGISVADKAVTGDLETVNGSIKLGRDVTVNGSLETVNGSLFVDRGGKITKGIENVNGSIGIVGTDLGGGIETVNGDITVGVGSHVRGGIKIEKNESWGKKNHNQDPRVIIGPNAVVEGPLVFERPVKLYVHSSARVGTVSGATAVAYSGNTAPSE